MNEVTNNDSHIVEDTPSALPQADTEISEALELFGIEDPQTDAQETNDELVEDPPIDQEPERKGITVKFNKEDRFIEEDQVAEYARKGLNYEKVEGRAKEYEAALDRTAKLNGFKDHAEYVANLDRLEQEAIQHKSNEIDTMKQQMLQEYADAGFDPAQLEAFIDNHPLIANAKAINEREQAALDAQKAQEAEQAKLQGWQDLFTKYPTLAESMSEDGKADWFTPELEAKISRGYDPIDAYELVNRNTITAEERRIAEQNVLKQQRLNKRAALGSDSLPADNEQAVPKELSDAFALFGFNESDAKKYMKK